MEASLAELVQEAMEKLLPGRRFVVLFEGAGDEDCLITSMTTAETLETLQSAMKVVEDA